MSIRGYRRNRFRKRQFLRELDRRCEAVLRRSFSASVSTWGGSRCPDCGVQVRPHQLFPQQAVKFSITGGKQDCVGRISVGASPNCELIKGCKGEVADWESAAYDRYKRRCKHLGKDYI